MGSKAWMRGISRLGQPAGQLEWRQATQKTSDSPMIHFLAAFFVVLLCSSNVTPERKLFFLISPGQQDSGTARHLYCASICAHHLYVALLWYLGHSAASGLREQTLCNPPGPPALALVNSIAHTSLCYPLLPISGRSQQMLQHQRRCGARASSLLPRPASSLLPRCPTTRRTVSRPIAAAAAQTTLAVSEEASRPVLNRDGSMTFVFDALEATRDFEAAGESTTTTTTDDDDLMREQHAQQERQGDDGEVVMVMEHREEGPADVYTAHEEEHQDHHHHAAEPALAVTPAASESTALATADAHKVPVQFVVPSYVT